MNNFTLNQTINQNFFFFNLDSPLPTQPQDQDHSVSELKYEDIMDMLDDEEPITQPKQEEAVPEISPNARKGQALFSDIAKLSEFLIAKMPEKLLIKYWDSFKAEAKLLNIPWAKHRTIQGVLLHAIKCTQRSISEREKANRLYTQLFPQTWGIAYEKCEACKPPRVSKKAAIEKLVKPAKTIFRIDISNEKSDDMEIDNARDRNYEAELSVSDFAYAKKRQLINRKNPINRKKAKLSKNLITFAKVKELAEFVLPRIKQNAVQRSWPNFETDALNAGLQWACLETVKKTLIHTMHCPEVSAADAHTAQQLHVNLGFRNLNPDGYRVKSKCEQCALKIFSRNYASHAQAIAEKPPIHTEAWIVASSDNEEAPLDAIVLEPASFVFSDTED